MKDITYEGPPLDEGQDGATKIPLRSKGSSLVPVLRTFQTDAQEEALKTTKLSLVMAERARKEEQGLSRTETDEPSHHLGRTIFLLLLVLAFGIGVGLYALIGNSLFRSSPSNTQGLPERKIIAQDGASLAINQSSREQILTSVADLFAQTTLAQGETRMIYFTATDATGENVYATTSAFLRKLGKAPSESFLRSLDTQMVYGVYSVGELVGFFEFHTRSYPETFAGMLAWESVMGDDLILLLNPKMKKSDIALLRGRAFKDERIAGVPARVLSNPDNVASIAYAFPDRSTLIIAGGRDTLRTLIERSRKESK